MLRPFLTPVGNPGFRFFSDLPLSLLFGGVLFLIFAFSAFLSLFWLPYDVTHLEISFRFQGPSLAHWLGTDHFGRDILSMLISGASVSLGVAVFSVFIGVMIGVPLGLTAAARYHCLPDEIIMRGSDLMLAFPSLVSAILITAVFGPSVLNSIIAIGIFNIPVFLRLSRAKGLHLWESGFVKAARMCGKGAFRISLEHILPNIAPFLIIQGTLRFSLCILGEATLSYLGLGAHPPLSSWGRMLSEAQTFITLAPHTAFVPGITIVLCVLSVNLVGEGLRELFDSQRVRPRS
ncbi:MAG: ABC transporter permease [Alphaproteobacteria bacterium]|nr:ABC transporter permease [Alphaproteobacteria bacterium]